MTIALSKLVVSNIFENVSTNQNKVAYSNSVKFQFRIYS